MAHNKFSIKDSDSVDPCNNSAPHAHSDQTSQISVPIIWSKVEPRFIMLPLYLFTHPLHLRVCPPTPFLGYWLTKPSSIVYHITQIPRTSSRKYDINVTWKFQMPGHWLVLGKWAGVGRRLLKCISPRCAHTHTHISLFHQPIILAPQFFSKILYSSELLGYREQKPYSVSLEQRQGNWLVFIKDPVVRLSWNNQHCVMEASPIMCSAFFHVLKSFLAMLAVPGNTFNPLSLCF